MARPSKFTKKNKDVVIGAIQGGNTREVAASLAGISESLLYEWLAKGRRGKEKAFVEFLEAIKRAEAFAHAERVSRVRDAGAKGSWQADAWWLERRYPQIYGKTRLSPLAEHVEPEIIEKVKRPTKTQLKKLDAHTLLGLYDSEIKN